MSSWHATEAAKESWDATKQLLFNPVRVGLWLRLALVVLLAGGMGGGNSSRVWEGTGDSGGIDFTVIAVILVVFAVVLFIALVFAYVSAVASYVYVESLIEREVKLISGFKRHAGDGLNLFLVQLAAYAILIVLFILGAFGFGALSAMLKSQTATIFLIVLGILILIPVVLVFALIMWALTEFAVPVAYAREKGILAAAREVYSLTAAQPAQFLVYLLVKIVLTIIAVIIHFIVSLPFIAVILVVALVFVLGFLATASAEVTVASVAIIALAIAAFIVLNLFFTYLILLITLPASVYLRYFSLIYLQRIDKTLDLFRPSEKNNEEASTEEAVKVY